MPALTFIARVTDGLLLVASTEHAGQGNDLEALKKQAKVVLKQLSTMSPQRMSIETGSYYFHYSIADGICTLTMTERHYPKQLAFSYLHELHQKFMSELKREYGDRWRTTIATSSKNMEKLGSELQDIHSIMKKNIQDVLSRGDKLDDISRQSMRLREQAKDFKWGAKKLNYHEFLRKWGPVILIGFFIFIVFYYKFIY
eukprot:GSMAST32.ASY1.ANO1.1337.1 assembled CDS